jgi:hypothetical protein
LRWLASCPNIFMFFTLGLRNSLFSSPFFCRQDLLVICFMWKPAQKIPKKLHGGTTMTKCDILIVFSRIPGKSWLFPWFPNSREILTIPRNEKNQWKISTVIANTNYLLFFRIESLVFMNKEKISNDKIPNLLKLSH